MRQFSVTLGLGRMANHHTKTYQVEAKTIELAICEAKVIYYEMVGAEIGDDAPIWGKILSVSEVIELN